MGAPNTKVEAVLTGIDGMGLDLRRPLAVFALHGYHYTATCHGGGTMHGAVI